MKNKISAFALALCLGSYAVSSNASLTEDKWYFHTAVSDTNTSTILSPYGYSLRRKTGNVEIGNRYFSAGILGAHYHIYGLGPKNFKLLYVKGNLDRKLSSDVTLKGSLKLGAPFEHDYHFRRCYDINAEAYLNFALNQDFGFDVGFKAQASFPFREAFPYLVLSYRSFKDHGLSFQAGYPSNSINYRFSDEYALSLEFVGLKHVVKLDDNTEFDTKVMGRVISIPVSYLIDDSLIADLKLTYTPTEHWRFEAGFGYTFHHYIKMVDEDGSQIASLKVKNGSIGYLRMRYYF